MRGERLDDRGQDPEVRFVDLHPLHEVSVGRQIMGDPAVELVREQVATPLTQGFEGSETMRS